MYMSDSVGIAELRQNLTRYLRRVAAGERLIVTDRNRPVAELGPPPAADASALVKLVRDELESAALRVYLSDADLVTCDLVLTEIPRAVRRAAADDPRLPLGLLLQRTEELLDCVAGAWSVARISPRRSSSPRLRSARHSPGGELDPA